MYIEFSLTERDNGLQLSVRVDDLSQTGRDDGIVLTDRIELTERLEGLSLTESTEGKSS